MNLHDMKLGDSVWNSEMQSNILRVPGGWIFRTADGDRDIYTASTFVPFDMEFKKTSEQGESPTTAGNIDYAAALRGISDYRSSEGDAGGSIDHLKAWLQSRLNSAKAPNCA